MLYTVRVYVSLKYVESFHLAMYSYKSMCITSIIKWKYMPQYSFYCVILYSQPMSNLFICCTVKRVNFIIEVVVTDRFHCIRVYDLWSSGIPVNSLRHTRQGLDTTAATYHGITHIGRDNLVAISQTTYSNAFSWTEMCEFRWQFHWSLYMRVQFTIFQHWFR